METMRCDVAVLGAGVNGTSIAYELCRRGKNVLLVDRKVMGAGASGACDDMILLQSKKPGILLEMAFASLERFKALKDELPCDIEFDTRGGTILIEDAEHLAVMEDFVAKQRACGLDVEIIDTARLRKLQPLVARDIIASTYSPTDSQVNPMLLMKGYALGGMKLGLRYLPKAWPVGIGRSGGELGYGALERSARRGGGGRRRRRRLGERSDENDRLPGTDTAAQRPGRRHRVPAPDRRDECLERPVHRLQAQAADGAGQRRGGEEARGPFRPRIRVHGHPQRQLSDRQHEGRTPASIRPPTPRPWG